MCVVCGCPVHTLAVDFLEFFPGNRNHHHFSDDAGLPMISNSFAIVKLATAKLKMKMLPTGFRVALSVVPPSSFPIDVVIEVFSSFKLRILSLTLLMLWTYRFQRLLRFRHVTILHVQALFYCIDKFWSLSKRFFGAHQHSNEESHVWRSATAQLSKLYSLVFQERCDRKA